MTTEQGDLSYASPRIFYGWWIVAAAFINLFFATGILFYGFPVFYPAFVSSLGFTRAQVTQGFLLGFLLLGVPFGLCTGALIDRIGARWVILPGAVLIGISLVLMGNITKLWQYETLCLLIVVGYTLSGPIANQVLVAQWFQEQRGRAMGYAYLGLGLGGVVAPWSANHLIRSFGWRSALEINGVATLLILLPVGFWITRSAPSDMGLLPDGATSGNTIHRRAASSVGVIAALKTWNFWLLTIGSACVIGAVNTIIQHFIFFLTDQGYSKAAASRFLSGLLISSLAGRVLVGYLADRRMKKNIMAFFYLLIGGSIPLLYLSREPVAAIAFIIVFGFSMGADYMLIPLVTAECFGIQSLGKLLALIIMGYSIGQWIFPWLAGRIFDVYRSYNLAWAVVASAGVLGAVAIYMVRTRPSSQML
jgi:MFS family permease